MPRFLGSPTRTVTFSLLYDTTQDVQTFSSRRAEVSAQTSQRFNRASTLLLRFAYRRVSTDNVNIPLLLIPQLLQPVRIGILSASYIQDHRDNSTDAHHGFWNTVDTGVAGNFFGSERNFVRVLGRNATYTPIGRNLVFARQTQIGAILPFHVPPTFRIPIPFCCQSDFLAGAAFRCEALGITKPVPGISEPRRMGGTPASVPTGFPIGGNALLFNTFELRFPLFGPNITGVLFHDTGNIYTNFSNVSLDYHQANNQDFNYALQSPGFGIRYKTPLGPLRVDFAYALNPPAYLGFNKNETIQDLIQCKPSQIGNPSFPNCTSSPERLNHFQFFSLSGRHSDALEYSAFAAIDALRRLLRDHRSHRGDRWHVGRERQRYRAQPANHGFSQQ